MSQGFPQKTQFFDPLLGYRRSGMASLPHFSVPYTVSTTGISGHWISKRLPQGNKAGEHSSLCQMEGGWCLTYAFYGKIFFYYNLKKTYKKLVMTWISTTWGQGKYKWFHNQQESILWSLEIMFTCENILKVLTTYS